MRVRLRRTGERGVTAVEFALIAPAFFLVFFGIFEMALLFESWVSVQHAAGMGARYAVTGRENCTGAAGRLGCIISEARNGVKHLPGGDSTRVDVSSWAYPDYAVPQAGPGRACDAVEVKVTYVHRLSTPLIARIIPSLTLTGTQRFVNEPFAKCGEA
jgi:hypothetical protein